MFRELPQAFAIILIFLATVCAFSGEIPVSSLENDIEITVTTENIRNSKYITLGEMTRLFRETDSGLDVEWDDTFGVLRISRGQDTYSLFPDKKNLLVNTRMLEVKEPVRVLSGRALVPLSSLRILNRFWKIFKIPEPATGATPTSPPSPTKKQANEPPPQTPAPETILPSSSRGVIRVVIDPASESLPWRKTGNNGVNIPEQDALTLKIALGIQRMLKREGSVEAVLTQRGDEKLSLTEKVERINRAGSDAGAGALVCLRLNASSFENREGFEIMVCSDSLDPEAISGGPASRTSPRPLPLSYLPWRKSSLELGNIISEELAKATPAKIGPLTPAPHYLMKRANAPSVLISCGYISNGSDRLRLSRESYLDSIARAISAALIRFADIRR